MSPKNHRSRNHLWLLDIAFFLLGGLLLILVLRLLSFHSPDPLTNAWTYVLGVPTVLLAVAMLTHTLSNDFVERSIQVGFLSSVIVHLLITWGASHWVLFGGLGNLLSERGELPADPIERTEPPVYFQPAPNLTTAERPDYMRPIPTESLNVDSPEAIATVAELKEASGASKLDIDVAPEPTVEFEKQVILPDQAVFPTPEPVFEAVRAELERPAATPDNADLASLPGSTVSEIPKTSIASEIEPEMLAPRMLELAPLYAANSPADAVSSSSLALPNSLPKREPIASPYIEDLQSNMVLPRSLTPVPQASDMTSDSRLSANALPDTEKMRQTMQPANVPPQSPTQDVVPIAEGLGVPKRADAPSLSEFSPESLRSSEASMAMGRREMSPAGDFTPLSPEALQQPLMSGSGREGTPSLANTSATSIDTLAKRGQRSDIELPDLGRFDTEPLRFMRPDALGASGVASSVPLPAPAFSQRIERVKERDKQATSSLGVLGPKTELAIERGLQFLAEHQREDGSWHLGDYPEPVRMQSETAATALALLSFQGAGYTHKQFKYEQVCRKALDALTRMQRPNGDLYQRGDSASDANAWLYSHAIATLALCEAYGMTQDEEIKINAQLAVDFLVASQDPDGGGWRYTPRIGSDTSVSGWVMMAFKSAELSGLKVDSKVYDGIERWLDNSQAKDAPYLYRYNWQANTPTTQHGRIPTPVMTSVGLLMRLYTGWRRDHPQMGQGTSWLLRYPPSNGTKEAPARDTYYWYYATQVMFHQGGEKWERWYGALYPLLIDSQELNGDWTGSWDPAGPIPDAWGEFGGRLYVTTLNLLSLEVYYRHLPLYDATAK